MRFAPPSTAFPPHTPPRQTAIPPALHTPQSPSIWTNYFVHHCQCFAPHDSHHTTPCLSTRPGLVFAYVWLPPPSSFLCILWLWFTGVHGSSNIFFSVHAHLCFLATCVIWGVDVAVGVLHECLGVFVCTQTNSGPETEHSQRQTRPRQPQARVSTSRADTTLTTLTLATPPWTALHPFFEF